MSTNVLKEIIDRAIDDETFRQLLLNNRDEALAEYTLLTDADRAKLINLTPDTFDEFAGSLGARTTKGMWKPGI